MRSDIIKGEGHPQITFKTMGYTDEEIARPLIGVANSVNEIVPGHIHLDKITEAVSRHSRRRHSSGIWLYRYL